MCETETASGASGQPAQTVLDQRKQHYQTGRAVETVLLQRDVPRAIARAETEDLRWRTHHGGVSKTNKKCELGKEEGLLVPSLPTLPASARSFCRRIHGSARTV